MKAQVLKVIVLSLVLSAIVVTSALACAPNWPATLISK